MSNKDEVNMRLGVATIERYKMGGAFPKFRVDYDKIMRIRELEDALAINVARFVSKPSMAAVTVFCSAHVPIQIFSDDDRIF
ncbi:hypothetical protein Aduo_015230 [Ancylostoma duodenale]